MGHSYKGGASAYRSLGDNARILIASYAIQEGYFGVVSKRGNSRVRKIETDNPLEEARNFYATAGYGGIEEQLEDGKWITTMKDGTVLTMREVSSSDGSPAVDINISKSIEAAGIKKQKIHFVEKKGK